MIKNILYTTDMNPYSSHVLGYVMDIAERFKSRITAVHAIEPVSLGEQHHSLNSDGKQAEQFRQSISRQVCDAVADDILCCENGTLDMLEKVRVEFGHAVDVILDVSRQEQADLIVMGSRRFADERRLLGSVIQPVLMASRVPVVVVPMPLLAGIYYRPDNQLQPPAG